jgi:DNA-binding MarR family transcriptional regulator
MSRLVNRGFVERQFDPALNYNFYTITAAGRGALRGDPQ